MLYKLITFLICIFLFLSFFSNSYAKKSLYELVNEINQTMPRRLNREMVMSGVNVRSPKEISYLLVNVLYSAEEVNDKKFKEFAYNWSRNSLCSNPDSSKMISMGYIFTYVYHGKNGKLISEISIDSCPK